MGHALRLAERGRGRTSPNPLVGAIVVGSDGVVEGTGFHAQAGHAHAEVRALAAAGPRARHATLYTTLEPCCHRGRTGPCVERIVAAGVSRVVASIEDPNPLVRGAGFAYLREHGILVDVGVGAEEATRQNEVFLTYMCRHRPFVIMKVALSLDGRIAERPGRRSSLTSATANRDVHLLRAEVDAIGVGVGTVLVDDPRLTVRGVYRGRPLTRVIFDARLDTPVGSRLFETLDTGPVVVLAASEAGHEAESRARALADVGAQVEMLPDRSVSSALTWLAAQGLTSILLEGGTGLHAAAWAAGVVDRVRVYVAPRMLGPSGVRWLGWPACSLADLRDVRVEPCGSDIVVDGHVHRAD